MALALIVCAAQAADENATLDGNETVPPPEPTTTPASEATPVPPTELAEDSHPLLVGMLDRHTDAVNTVWAQGKYIFTGSDDGTSMVWSRKDFSPGLLVRMDDATVSELVADDTYIYTVAYETVARVWSNTNFSPVGTLEGHTDLVTGVWSDGERVYTASDDKTVRVYRRADLSLENVLRGHRGWVTDVVTNTDHIFTASFGDKEVRLWRRSDLSPAGTLAAPTPTGMQVVFADDEHIFTDGRDTQAKAYTVQVWRADDLSPVAVLGGHNNTITAIHADEDYVYTASRDGTIRLWNRTALTLLTTLTGHTDAVTDVFADADFVYTASWDGTARVWRRPDAAVYVPTVVMDAPPPGEEDPDGSDTNATNAGNDTDDTVSSDDIGSIYEGLPDAWKEDIEDYDPEAGGNETGLEGIFSGTLNKTLMGTTDMNDTVDLNVSGMEGVTPPPDTSAAPTSGPGTFTQEGGVYDDAEVRSETFRMADGNEDWAAELAPKEPSKFQMYIYAGLALVVFGSCVFGYFSFCRGS
jgi:hypothetical protein